MLDRYCPHRPTDRQGLFLCLPHREAFYGGAAGGGKAGILTSMVITPFGPKQMGDMRVGDQVLNPDGTVARVLQVHPQGEQATYRVSFSDGTFYDCTLEHRWLAWESGKRYKAARTAVLTGSPLKGRIYTTEQIRAITVGDAGTEGRGVLIPVTQPVTFTKSYRYDMRKIDPYVLGALLGDGGFSERTNVTFVTPDPEIAAAISSTLGCTLTDRGKRGEAAHYAIPGDTSIKNELKRLDLIGHRSWEKFIPEPYLYAPIEDRWQLLRGLMDTDGTASTDGKIYYSTTSPQLAHEVRWLIESLGGVATITDKDTTFTAKGESFTGRRAYTLYIKLPDPAMAFNLGRKKARCVPPQGVYRRIVSVEPIGRQACQCITVDHPNGLYLGDDFIVTHNSDALLMAALLFVDVPGYAALILRRTYADLALPGAIMDRAAEWFRPTVAHWQDDTKTWIFPSSATITFGYLQTEADKYRYQGAEFQFVGYDELPQFTETQYTYLLSRLRRLSASPVPLRQRGAGNPGGIGHEWVKARFIDTTTGRPFIPAKLIDNPHLDQVAYRESLAGLDDVTRAQLEDGNWDVQPSGGYFQRSWFTIVDALPQ